MNYNLFLASKQPKVILLPGGTGYIGSNIVKLFLEQGAYVAVPSISGDFSKLTNELKNKFGNKLILEKCNYYKDAAAKEFIEQIKKKAGSIDCLVYCAGVWLGHQLVHKTSAEEVSEIVSCELGGLWNFVRNVIPDMKKRKYGRIIALGSLSMGQGKAYLGSHSVIKGALAELIQTLANEQGPYGIRANIIAPSIVSTESERKQYPHIDNKYMVPINVICDFIFLLCYSKLGMYINGQTLKICSPWERYLQQRKEDLFKRGCADIN